MAMAKAFRSCRTAAKVATRRPPARLMQRSENKILVGAGITGTEQIDRHLAPAADTDHSGRQYLPGGGRT